VRFSGNTNLFSFIKRHIPLHLLTNSKLSFRPTAQTLTASPWSAAASAGCSTPELRPHLSGHASGRVRSGSSHFLNNRSSTSPSGSIQTGRSRNGRSYFVGTSATTARSFERPEVTRRFPVRLARNRIGSVDL